MKTIATRTNFLEDVSIELTLITLDQSNILQFPVL